MPDTFAVPPVRYEAGPEPAGLLDVGTSLTRCGA